MADTKPTEADAPTAAADIRVRNIKRAQWFFRFPVNADEIAILGVIDDKGTCAVKGCRIDTGSIRVKKGGKMIDTPAKICTLALGDSEAHESEIPPETSIPRVIWDALMREPTQAAAMQGLLDKGEVAIYGNALAA